ncbi:MAG: pyruvate dehydrogenase complex E1 component subunit beta [Pseudomonadota bacterium]
MATIFDSKEELQAVLTRLWEAIFATPAISRPLTAAPIVIKFRYADLGTDLYLAVEGGQGRILWDPKVPPEVDVEMILSSDTSHRFWMETLNVPMAIASRKIVAKGSMQKALKLIPALKPAFALYPGILTEMGRGDLLKTAPAERKRQRRLSFLFRGKRTGLDPGALPVFPTAVGEPPRAAPAPPPPAAPAGGVDLYRVMSTIRAFENHLATAFAGGELPTEAIHLSIGQEAVAAGVCLNLRRSDYINTTHRGHGHIIAKGAAIGPMMAELYGKAGGLCEGKGGSMHVTDGAIGVLGANGIVGAGYLLAMGAALAIRRQGRDDISVVFAGDGSVNQGMFHEALNMAALFDLPLLVIVENNLYGEFTPIARHSAETDITRRLAACGIPASRLDGNDAATVFREVGRIVADMRRDGCPRALELLTYRWHGHMEGEPESYRSPEEKARHMAEDPIARLGAALAANGDATTSELTRIGENCAEEIAAAAASAVSAADPAPAALTTRVYAPEDPALFTGEIPVGADGPDMSYAAAINRAIAEEMERDPRVFLWGEDVTLGGYFNVTEGLVAAFGPERIIDTPISENGIVGGAVGAAMAGMRPICEILFADFLSCCMDPILNQAAKLRYMTGGQVSIPITIRTPVGSGIGMAAQHSQSMERFFFGIPGLMVVAPSDPFTALGLLKAAIRSNNPVLFFEHKLLYAVAGPVPEPSEVLPLGKARIARKGRDATIVTHLLGVSVSLEAADALSAEGIDVEVIDLLTLYPMDTGTILSSVARTGRLVTVEEGTATGGIGAEVIARVSTAGHRLLKAPPVRIAAPECPVPYAKGLEAAMMPQPENIAAAVISLVRG